MKRPLGRATTRVRPLALAGAAGLAAVLAACGGGSSASSSTSGSSAQSASKSTSAAAATGQKIDVAKAGDVTLTVWDQEVRGGQSQQITELNREFHKKYPNVTIKRVSKSFTDLNTTLKLAASGNNPPDVVQANNGYSVMGPLVKARLLRPLDRYAKSYGWTKRYPKGILDMNRFSPDGKQFGGSSLFGLAQVGEVVGVFYNKTKLGKLGLKVPGSFGAFESDLAKAKAAGEIPIQFGNLDKWPGIHEYETIATQTAPKSMLRNFIFGRDHATFEKPQLKKAATILSTWAEKGYFTQGFNGLGYDDSWKQFGQGKGVFLISGSWLTPDLTSAMGKRVGFFLMPPMKAGAPPVSLGGEGLPFAITSKSKNPDVAAAYIDFLTNAHAMKVEVQKELIPAVPPKGQTYPKNTAYGDVMRAWTALGKSDGVVGYLDWSTPTIYDTLTAAVQKLTAQKMSPSDFVSAIQSDYSKFQKSQQ